MNYMGKAFRSPWHMGCTGSWLSDFTLLWNVNSAKSQRQRLQIRAERGRGGWLRWPIGSPAEHLGHYI